MFIDNAGSVSLLRLGQLMRFVVWLAVQLLHFFAKVRAIIPVCIGERPGLSLVIPIVRIQPLRFLEMRDRLGSLPDLVKILAQGELDIGACSIFALRFQTLFNSLSLSTKTLFDP